MWSKIAIITGRSASGKTTLQKELIERWWVTPVNFTTREPRNDEEYDDYIFLTKDQYFEKLKRWDFFEYMELNWEYYAISRFWDTGKNVVLVLDVAWREQVIKKLYSDGVPYKTFYLDIDTDTQVGRMIDRWDRTLDIEKRVKNELYFPTPECNIFDGKTDTKTLANIIENTYEF